MPAIPMNAGGASGPEGDPAGIAVPARAAGA
jgi:hypothetical protein